MISSLDHLVLVEIGPVHHAVSHGYESPSPLLDPYGLGESPLSMRHPDSSPIFRVWLSGAVGRVRTLHTHFSFLTRVTIKCTWWTVRSPSGALSVLRQRLRKRYKQPRLPRPGAWPKIGWLLVLMQTPPQTLATHPVTHRH